jgi:uncharacterized membrane protein (DUF4010 family)
LDTKETLISLGLSLGLGLLVGLQRERKGEELAGIRTFALITVLGTIAAMVEKQLGSIWIVPLGVAALGGVMSVGAYVRARMIQKLGLTTEIAALVMYLLGAYLVEGDRIAALVFGGVVVLLLYWKNVLHGFVQKMGDRDFSAIMQFVLIALVIWPVLPREKFGPYGFFNPFETWLVVVLVVGMSLGGYVLYKLVPPAAGAILGGAVGGLISSTATTVSYARRSKSEPGATVLAVQAIMTANTVSIGRVMVLLALFARTAVPHLLPPLAAMAGTMALLTLIAWWLERHEKAELPEQENPTEMKTAIVFAFIYTGVKLATAWGKATFGVAALFIVGAISGLTDVDAITLSMSEAARNFAGASVAVPAGSTAGVDPATAWRVVLTAILANLVFKGGTVMALGNPRLKKWIAALFGAAMLAGIAILILWPG